ncbi:MAG: hypothetical protein ACE5EY_14915, partial [Anaerolineae bacterium]
VGKYAIVQADSNLQTCTPANLQTCKPAHPHTRTPAHLKARLRRPFLHATIARINDKKGCHGNQYPDDVVPDRYF